MTTAAFFSQRTAPDASSSSFHNTTTAAFSSQHLYPILQALPMDDYMPIDDFMGADTLDHTAPGLVHLDNDVEMDTHPFVSSFSITQWKFNATKPRSVAHRANPPASSLSSLIL
ncbi:hypothetical protein NEOLEDRAFT_1141130 [Neolentinus lepideus HHB14362 ss-1]|uniref:Uncharacterized protein n=1 Tax=Neolentinus lepideus HHB14362 ss-1 TaxID=1314782 RepID=A0A165NVE0_9AGAM|nr:hypothetical protein NEOLEDRAFT_1141130 [Neolentinus lepideus HHB14362 ss-1]